MSETEVTKDHEKIKSWVESRNGSPAVVDEATDTDSGVLRIRFKSSKELRNVSWEEFFEVFDKQGLSFLYQEMTSDDEESYFCKFIYE